MNIEFGRIEIRNFMSYAEEAFDFTQFPGLNLVQGKNNDIPNSKNGVGKTQLFSSLIYVLFGQLQNEVKNKNLVNRKAGNQDMDIIL